MSGSLYNIGVNITASNNVSAVLNVIQRQVLGLHNAVNLTTAGFSRLKLAAVGVFGVAAGVAMLGVMGKLVKSSEEYNRQLVLMKRAGFTPEEIGQARAGSNSVSDMVHQVAPAEAMQMVRELRGILGTTEHALQALPEFAKSSAMLDVVLGKHDPRAMANLAKALELQGGIYGKNHEISAGAMRTSMNEMMATLVAAGGQLTPLDLLGVMKQAGPMARMMTPAMFQDTIMTAVMEMGGQRTGTALSAVGRALYGGIMPQRNADEFAKLGLLESGKYHVLRGGHVKVDPGGMAGLGTLNSEGLLGYVDKVLRPALVKSGFTTAEAQQQEMYRLFPTETARRLIGLFLQQEQAIRRDMELRRKAGGGDQFTDGRRDRDSYGESKTDAYSRMMGESLGMATKGFHEQLERVMTNLGLAITPTVVTVLNGLGNALAIIGRAIEAHPTITKIVVGLFAGIGLALTALGGLAMGAAALATLSAVGIGAGTIAIISGIIAAIPLLVYALMRFGPAIWAWVVQAKDALTAAAKGIAERLRNVWIRLLEGLIDLGNRAYDGFMGLVDRISTAIRDMLAKLVGMVAGSGVGRPFNPGAPASNDTGLPGVSLNSFRSTIPPAANTNIHNIKVEIDGHDVRHRITHGMARDMNSAPLGGAIGADQTISPYARSI